MCKIKINIFVGGNKMYKNNELLDSKLEELRNYLPAGKPIGITFSTPKQKYYYDTVTGKIIACQELEYQIIQKLLEGKLEDIKQIGEPEKVGKILEDLINLIKTEKIFALSKFSKMVDFGDYEDLIQNELEQVTLELTEKCNLRCGYCIYNEACEKNRDFGERDMPEAIAYKAIDYAKKHSSRTEILHIGYYGGEPLINYQVMINSMKYAIETITDKKLHFAFTTNAVLLTKERCEELSQIPNLSVTISLDGPEKWHDFYRKNINGCRKLLTIWIRHADLLRRTGSCFPVSGSRRREPQERRRKPGKLWNRNRIVFPEYHRG